VPLPEKATHQQTRAFNAQLVLRTIYDRPAISRADVARLTGLTRTSVSALVAELLDSGLVQEVGRGQSTGGKAPILLRVVPDARHVVGLDLGGGSFTGAIVDLRGRIVRSAERPLRADDGRQPLELVFSLVDELVGAAQRPVLGIGIGTPGLIDSETGTVRWAVNLDWSELPLGDLIAERTGLPVHVANDSHAAALAEYTFGSEPSPDNLVVVMIGRGIGAGIVLNGQLFSGDAFGAGEIGHTTVVEAGEPCRCGSVGCLETVASVRAIVDRLRHLAPRHPGSILARDPDGIDETRAVQAFLAGDPLADDVVLEAARQVGRALAALVGALNVRRIVVVGAATAFGDRWLEAARHETRERSLPLLGRDTEVVFGRSRDDVVVLGASALLMTRELGLSLVR